MSTTLPARPDQRPPAGELLTFTTFNDISLWVTYRVDDGELIVEHVWINGAWVDACALFGEAQYLAWCTATEADLYADACVMAEAIMETLPAFEASLLRAEMRRAA